MLLAMMTQLVAPILGMSMAGVGATSWVIIANNMEALLFHSDDAPAAVGDNVTNPISAQVRQKALAEFVYDDAGWVNQLGAIGTGVSGFQYALPGIASQSQGTTPLFAALQRGRAFSFVGKPVASRSVIVVLRALAAWDPANENQQISFALDIEV